MVKCLFECVCFWVIILVHVAMQSSMQADKEQLEQLRSERQKLEEETASRQQQEQKRNEEHKQLQEKLGRAEQELSKVQGRSAELEHKVAELQMFKDKTQVSSWPPKEEQIYLSAWSVMS